MFVSRNFLSRTLRSVEARLFAFAMMAAVAIVPSTFGQNGGAVQSDFYAQMPTMYYKGTWYSTPNLGFGSTAPTSATITVVAWTWAFNGANAPTGLMVQLCNTDPAIGTCIDISSSPHGTTTVWQGDSLAGGAKFQVK